MAGHMTLQRRGRKIGTIRQRSKTDQGAQGPAHQNIDTQARECRKLPLALAQIVLPVIAHRQAMWASSYGRSLPATDWALTAQPVL